MSLIENRLKSEIINFFSDLSSFSGGRVLLGFSGGADSLCLALLISENRKELNIVPALAYFDHGIRSAKEMTAENSLIRSLSSDLGIKLYTGQAVSGELNERAVREGRSLEDTAREARYSFFNRIIEEEGFDYLLLGHHQDDQMETLIMRFFQGSGVSGLGGISGVRTNILRPLLGIDKKSIISFLEGRERRWVTDSSNFKNDFLRNRVRNILVPEIEAVFPGYRKSLTSLSGKMGEVSAFIENEVGDRIKWTTESEPGTFSMDSSDFFNSPRLLLIQSLYNLYNLTYPERKRVPFRFLNSLPEGRGAGVRRGENATILSGCGINLKINKDRVFWTRDIVFPRKNSYLIMTKSKQTFSLSEFNFHVDSIERKDIPQGGVYIRKDVVNPPLLVRSRLTGDEIDLPEGKKSLKKLFNEWQIDAGDRWKIPVLHDRNGILGVIGSPWGGFNRFSKRNEVMNKTESDECWFIKWSLREF